MQTAEKIETSSGISSQAPTEVQPENKSRNQLSNRSEIQSELPVDRPEENVKRNWKRTGRIALFGIGVLMFICCCVALVLISNFGFYQLDGVSMSPTISDGQRLLAQYKLPQRGEVAIYEQVRGIKLVHRVAAVPGDRVEFRDGRLYVNEKVFTAGGDCEVTPLNLPADSSLGNNFVMPADKFLLIGDNSDNARDSRYTGLVDKNNISATILFAGGKPGSCQ